MVLFPEPLFPTITCVEPMRTLEDGEIHGTYTELASLDFEADVAQRIMVAPGVFEADGGELNANTLCKCFIVLWKRRSSGILIAIIRDGMHADAVGYIDDLV